MPVHASAEEGYANVGATYDKGRPEYPSDAVAYLLHRTIDWVAAIWKEVDAARDDTPNAWTYAWRDAFNDDRGFTPLTSTTFRHDHPTDRDGLVARVCDEAGLPEQFVLPYNCFVHWCRRR